MEAEREVRPRLGSVAEGFGKTGAQASKRVSCISTSPSTNGPGAVSVFQETIGQFVGFGAAWADEGDVIRGALGVWERPEKGRMQAKGHRGGASVFDLGGNVERGPVEPVGAVEGKAVLGHGGALGSDGDGVVWGTTDDGEEDRGAVGPKGAIAVTEEIGARRCSEILHPGTHGGDGKAEAIVGKGAEGRGHGDARGGNRVCPGSVPFP